jgi:hypothetical protein
MELIQYFYKWLWLAICIAQPAFLPLVDDSIENFNVSRRKVTFAYGDALHFDAEINKESMNGIIP